MSESLHYLLMSDHLLFQKTLLSDIKNIGLTPGQPKVLDYLLTHDGAFQKEIAEACHIEPATITSVLLGMENNGLITRKNLDGNRRNLYVYLTEKGKASAQQIDTMFAAIEKKALTDFEDDEKEQLCVFLAKINKNMSKKGDAVNA